MAEEGKGKIEKFNGMNFQWWKMQVEDYLYQKDMYLPPVGEKPEAMNVNEWTILDRKALATVRQVAFNISKEKTTAAVMKALEKLYEKPSASNKVFLMKKLFNMRMSENGSVVDHLNDFSGVTNQLESVGINFDDEIRALLFLCSLPDSWNNLVTTEYMELDEPEDEQIPRIKSLEVLNETTDAAEIGAGDQQQVPETLNLRRSSRVDISDDHPIEEHNQQEPISSAFSHISSPISGPEAMDEGSGASNETLYNLVAEGDEQETISIDSDDNSAMDQVVPSIYTHSSHYNTQSEVLPIPQASNIRTLKLAHIHRLEENNPAFDGTRSVRPGKEPMHKAIPPTFITSHSNPTPKLLLRRLTLPHQGSLFPNIGKTEKKRWSILLII
ncbi:hypothetical protein RJ640_016740 [Escallonia rubra]|uniref:Retrovirus-related Pol polyprotein from transposon TNT 1-94 n=1 Tax=Escallonia rubra TaxID=112253 RepID=A0AA88QNW2_9ASTE|nr:hypothetical protein RJ640_016740 [Escallonia rubra]